MKYHLIKQIIAPNGRADVYNLAGASHSKDRQMLMVLLTGQNLAKAKCGVNAVWDALKSVAPAEFGKECRAVQEKLIGSWLEEKAA